MKKVEYVILGIQLTQEEAFNIYHPNDTFDNYEVGNVVLIKDVFWDQYYILGKILAKGGDEGLLLSSFSIIDLTQELPSITRIIDETEMFDLPAGLLPIKLFILSHYQYDTD